MVDTTGMSHPPEGGARSYEVTEVVSTGDSQGLQLDSSSADRGSCGSGFASGYLGQV